MMNIHNTHKHSKQPDARAQREAVLQVACPTCGAEGGRRCIGRRVQVRYAHHKERWEAWCKQNNGKEWRP